MRIGHAAALVCILMISLRLLSLLLLRPKKAMITVTQSISGTYFSSNVPDVVFSIGGYRALVGIAVDGERIYQEHLFPVNGQISLVDLDRLLTPYARQALKASLSITIEEQNEGSDKAVATTTLSADIIYCEADIGTTAADFVATHFLTLLEGEKLTALNRLEYLHYIGTERAMVVASYEGGMQKLFMLKSIGGNDKYTTLDVSPSQFVDDSYLLLGYVVRAGQRSFRFAIDFDEPDCAPVLVFDNSFGVEELLYCTGTHTISPSYKRSQGYVGRLQRNYEIAETRTFKADTGILTFPMANWADELFRSPSVKVVVFKDGHANVGKEVLITDSKSEYTNEDDSLPRFTFSYQYAQRNHNVVGLVRAGRIFDNTFDNTFN